MYKVLIVEDEMLVRTGIRASIDWEKFNMSVIGEAANGQIAWELYQKMEPDLVLTDIKMPFMDGIELIRKIRSTDRPTQIIILSCLEDFSLAREAIHLGVCGYILKLTMVPEEMEQVLQTAKQALDEVIKPKSSSVPPMSADSILRSNLLGYLSCNVPSLSTCLSALENCQIKIHSSDLAIALMDIVQYDHLENLYRDKSGQLIHFSIQNILNEILSKNHSGIVMHEVGSRYLILFHSASQTGSFAEIQGVLEEIITIMKNYFNVEPRFYLSQMEQDIQHLKDLYDQCLVLSEYGFFMENASINQYREDYADSLRQTLIFKTRRMLSSLQSEEFFLTFVLRPLEQSLSQDFSQDQIRHLLFDSYITCLHHQQLDENNFSQKIGDFLQSLSVCTCYYTMLSEFLTQVSLLKKQASETISYSREIVQALHYLQNHYQGQIVLNEVAHLVGLSPNYFSSIFKKELGTSFSEYLNRYRIEKSMELLQNTNLKSYEIAYQCGFSDEGYYGKIFKKYTGKTPNEHKKSCPLNQTS